MRMKNIVPQGVNACQMYFLWGPNVLDWFWPWKGLFNTTGVYMQMIDKTDLIGKVFDRLTVMKIGPDYVPLQGMRKGQKHTRYYCDCTCGTRNKLVRRDALLKGTTRSCGCISREKHNSSVRAMRAERTRGIAPGDYYTWKVANDF